jgi:hypothetical protein
MGCYWRVDLVSRQILCSQWSIVKTPLTHSQKCDRTVNCAANLDFLHVFLGLVVSAGFDLH